MTTYRCRETDTRYGRRFVVQIIVHGRHFAFREFPTRQDAERFIAEKTAGRAA